MQRSCLVFSCTFVALVGCAAATPDGTPSDGAVSHDSGVHGADTSTGGEDSATTTDTATTTDSGSTTDSSTSLDTGSPPADGASDAPTDPSCAASTSSTDCETCCYTAHTDAYNAFADALLGCACKPGNCDTQCGATACASPPAAADTTCTACLSSVQTGACKADIDAVCSKPSGACYPFARCVITSGCNSKP